MFYLFEGMFILVFGLVIATFVVTAIRGITLWNKNNHSPRLTVSAKVVAKRMEVARYRRGGTDPMHQSTTSSFYYVTFQVASGDRMELRVSGYEYGTLVEEDYGELSFQGTRYLGFERKTGYDG